MANPNISLWGATYSGVPGINLPTSGGGTATFPWVEGSQTVTQNGTVDVTSLAQIIVNVAGGGSSVLSGTVTPASNTNGMTINVGANFTHFVVYSTTNSGGNNIKAFRAAICDFSASITNIVAIATNNSGSSIAGGTNSSSYTWFTKSGTSVVCKTGTSGANNPGYWAAGITYQWFAW